MRTAPRPFLYLPKVQRRSVYPIVLSKNKIRSQPRCGPPPARAAKKTAQTAVPSGAKAENRGKIAAQMGSRLDPAHQPEPPTEPAIDKTARSAGLGGAYVENRGGFATPTGFRFQPARLSILEIWELDSSLSFLDFNLYLTRAAVKRSIDFFPCSTWTYPLLVGPSRGTEDRARRFRACGRLRPAKLRDRHSLGGRTSASV